MISLILEEKIGLFHILHNMEQSLFRNLFEIPLKIIIFPMAAGILFLEREIERVSLSFRLSALGIFDASFNNRNKSKITLSVILKGKC